MTTMNQFTVSGNLCADAQIKEFKNTTSKILRIGIFINSSRKVKNEAEIRIFYENKKWVKVEENTYKNQKMTAGEHQGIL